MAANRDHLYHQTAVAMAGQMDAWLAFKTRLATFVNWPYDREADSECTSKKLALSGFRMTDAANKSAICVCCEKEMEFEAEDIPHAEHCSHSPFCFYAAEGADVEGGMSVHRALKAMAWKVSFEEAASTRILTEEVSEAMENARKRAVGLFLDAENEINKR
ncbi:Baculoviral IAP repeat-containing protein 5-like protein [Aphelenchoides fujianensis]|nr:Baculoviral IAP repeat-containing protein 5-like protein [Aphelenchoides fujianensis]